MIRLTTLGVCVFLLLATCRTDSTNRQEIQEGVRRMRSVSAFQQGVLAVQKLLGGTRYMRNKCGVRTYEKTGNKETAMREFTSLDPENVKRVEFYKHNKGVKLNGRVGNKLVVYKDYGGDAYPVIEVIDPGAKAFRKISNQHGQYGIRVVYKDKVAEKNGHLRNLKIVGV